MCVINTRVDEWQNDVSWASASAGSTANVEQASGAEVVDDDKRQKNRSAARKCREKRLDRQREMRRQVTDVGSDNQRLTTNIRQLRRQVQQLQNLLADHRLGPCRLYGSSASTVTALHTSTTAVDSVEQMMNDTL